MILEEKTILHVDDDADDRELLQEVMQKVAPEVQVTYAENGLSALKVLNEGKSLKSLPCLIVLDLNMPFLDGKQTYEKIQADPELKNIPLIVLSSGQNPADKNLFAKQGVAYFAKPVEFSVLKEIATHISNLCC